MVGSLKEVKAKLARAGAHLNAVKSALQQFTKAEPQLIPGEYDADTPQYLFRSQRDSPNPAHISPVIGDCGTTCGPHSTTSFGR